MDSIDYYDKHSGEYYEATVDLDMSKQLERFFELLPENAEVLDLGCGSGRDTVWLEEAGCYVTPMDGSAQMCELAGIYTDKEVLNLTFEEMDFEEVFDGIWACASLTHVPKSEMDSILDKVRKALCPSGVLYMSFPEGEGMEESYGRTFNKYTTETLHSMMYRHDGLEIIDIWLSGDVRPGNARQWVNVLARKTGGMDKEDAEE